MLKRRLRNISRSRYLFHTVTVTIRFVGFVLIGHFLVMYLVAKPLIWSEAEGDLVVIETSI